ncbi:hypothetical protein B0H14DRAFT_2629091 [Mycena olivaceomarginata]|nr:hypothetical protein B0H14DRAFT_2629091 [Mycena olivaceomarginata]
MFAITKKYQMALCTPVANFMVEKQTLETNVVCWDSHPLDDENEHEEANDEDTIFHPSFIFDLNFTGETDIPVSDYREIHSSSWLDVLAFSPGVINTFHAAPQPLDGDLILNAHSKSFAEGTTASPPHGIYTLLLNPLPADHLRCRRFWWLPRGHNTLSLAPMPIHPHFVREERVFKETRGLEIEYLKYVFMVMKQMRWKRGSSPFWTRPTEDTWAPVFRGPALQTSAVHAEEVEETHKLHVLEADITHEQKIRDAAESHLIPLPPSLPSRVFVPPPANIDNEITSPVSEESVLPVSLSAHASPERAVTAFRIIPTLPAHFQSFFRSDADPDAQDTECAEDTFDADSEWEVEIAVSDLQKEVASGL